MQCHSKKTPFYVMSDPSLYSAHKKLETCTIDPPLSDHFFIKSTAEINCIHNYPTLTRFCRRYNVI